MEKELTSMYAVLPYIYKIILKRGDMRKWTTVSQNNCQNELKTGIIQEYKKICYMNLQLI